LCLVQQQEDERLRWPGFVVFGYGDEAAKLTYSVLNLPYQYAIVPSEWWRLAHEAGHACAELQRLLDFPELRTMVQHLEVVQAENRDIRGDPEELVQELVANIFEFELAFRRHFDLYVRTVWRFFNRRLEGREQEGRLIEQLLRTTFVFLYDLEQQGILQPGQGVDQAIKDGTFQHPIPEDKSMDICLGLRALGEYRSLEDLIEAEVIRQAIDAAPRLSHAIRPVAVDRIAELYRACEPWRTEFAHIFRRIRLVDPSMPHLEEHLQQLWDSLATGNVLNRLPQTDVFLIPLALQYQCQVLSDKGDTGLSVVPLRVRIAAMLSLWHWDRIHKHL
jgi:hypothetical protein